MGKRFDIWWNGTYNVKVVFWSLLGMWRHLLPECGRFGLAAVEFISALAVCMWVLIAPLCFWLAPVLALFTAHEMQNLEDEY